MKERRWRVGELATAAGLTVRTLHHYDELGLLAPSRRSEAGHRLYTEADLQRLYRILALRRLGMPLAEVGRCLDGQDGDLRQVIQRQLDQVTCQLALQTRLRLRLSAALEACDGGEPAIDQLITIMEAMTMFERYYTPEQLAQLEERRQALGEEGMTRAEQAWAELIRAVEAERQRGTPPTDPRVQDLARQWQGLIQQFTGGDAGMRRSLQTLYEQEGMETASRGMVSPELMGYIAQAMDGMPE